MTFERPEFYDRLRRAQDGVDNNLSVTIRYVLWIPTRLITSVGLLAYLATANLILPVVMVAGLVPVYLVSAHYSRRLYALRRRHTPDERRPRLPGRPDDRTRGRPRRSGCSASAATSWTSGNGSSLNCGTSDSSWPITARSIQWRPPWGDQLTYAVVILGLVVLIAGGRPHHRLLRGTARCVGAVPRCRWPALLLYHRPQ